MQVPREITIETRTQQNLGDAPKAVIRGKLTEFNVYVRKEKRVSNHSLRKKSN